MLPQSTPSDPTPALLELDRRMTILGANEEAETLFGARWVEMSGRRMLEFFEPEDLIDISLPLRGEVARLRAFPVRVKCKSGPPIPVAVHLFMMKTAEEPRWLASLVDARSTAAGYLPNIGGVMVPPSEFLGHLVRGTAHKLNNLFTVFHGYGELLASDETLDSMTKEAVQQIQQAAGNGSHLVERLLEIGSRVGLQIGPVPLDSILEKVRVHWNRVLHEGVTFEIHSDGAPIRLETDPQRAADILSELLDNSLGMLASASGVRKIQLDVKPETEFMLFRVTDTGPGVPQGEESKIFLPYITHRKNAAHLGLGLPAALGLAHALGGNLTHTRLPDGQGCFELRLPLSKPAE